MFAAITKHLIRFNLAREDGQAMAEYGLILALVALAVITAIGVLGGDISTEFGKISTALGV